MKTYTVSTQHGERLDGAFITPIQIDAVTPFAAAHDRLKLQSQDSQNDTTALLVTYPGTGRSFVYPVRAVRQPCPALVVS